MTGADDGRPRGAAVASRRRCSPTLLALLALAVPCLGQVGEVARAPGDAPTREPRWQGLTLAEWLREGTRPTSPDTHMSDEVRRHARDALRSRALAVLAPGSPHEAQALDWLVAGLPATADLLPAFGERALPALLDCGEKRGQRATFATAVIRTGAAGVRRALHEMRDCEPWERTWWVQAFGAAPPAASAALATALVGAGAATVDDALDCLSRMPRVLSAVYEPVASLLTHERHGVRAVRILASLSCEDLRPALEALSHVPQPEHHRRRMQLARAVVGCRDDWAAAAAADPGLVVLLCRCLDTSDPAAMEAVLLILGRMGTAAREAAEDLLRIARTETIDDRLRADAFAALWRVAPPSPDALAALGDVLTDPTSRNRSLVDACIGRLAPLGAAGVPFLRQALASASRERRTLALAVLRSIGAAAAEAAADVEALIERVEHTWDATRTLLAIAPQRWSAVEPRLLERARAELAAGARHQAAIALLIEHGRPTGEVLDFFVELYRRDDDTLRRYEERLTRHLYEGEATAAFVDALASGRVTPSHQTRQIVELLCEKRPPLQAAVPRLKAAIRAFEDRLAKPRMLDFCSTRTDPTHALQARLLGAAGELDFLRALAASEIVEVQKLGDAGLGEMARHDVRAAELLIARLAETAAAGSRGDSTAFSLAVERIQSIADALSRSGPGTARMLTRSLLEVDRTVAPAFLTVLTRMGNSAVVAVPAIEQLLRDTTDAIVAGAARAALRGLAPFERGNASELPRVLLALEACGGDGLPEDDLVLAILRLLPERAPPILAAAHDLSPRLRAWLVAAAAGAPSAAHGPLPTPPVQHGIPIQYSMSEPRTSSEPPPDAELFLPFTADPDPIVRALALRVVQDSPRAGAPPITDRLVELATGDPHWQIRTTALSLLQPQPVRPRRALSPQQLKAVRGALADPDRSVRAKAREVLPALERR